MYLPGGFQSYGPVLVTGGGDSAVIIWEVSHAADGLRSRVRWLARRSVEESFTIFDVGDSVCQSRSHPGLIPVYLYAGPHKCVMPVRKNKLWVSGTWLRAVILKFSTEISFCF